MTAHAVVRQVVPADAAAAFDVVHEYGRRLEWDTLLRSATTVDDAPPDVGVESVCTAHHWLAGLSFRTRFVTFRRPPGRAGPGDRAGRAGRPPRDPAPPAGPGRVPFARMIGRVEKSVLDCPDPRALAAFYADLLGMRVVEDDGDGAWVVIGRDRGWRELAFQRADPYVAPSWPAPQRPQQVHLDIRVDDVEAAEREVLRLGAALLAGEQGTGFRVYADPAGHPFCLVY